MGHAKHGEGVRPRRQRRNITPSLCIPARHLPTHGPPWLWARAGAPASRLRLAARRAALRARNARTPPVRRSAACCREGTIAEGDGERVERADKHNVSVKASLPDPRQGSGVIFQRGRRGRTPSPPPAAAAHLPLSGDALAKLQKSTAGLLAFFFCSVGRSLAARRAALRPASPAERPLKGEVQLAVGRWASRRLARGLGPKTPAPSAPTHPHRSLVRAPPERGRGPRPQGVARGFLRSVAPLSCALPPPFPSLLYIYIYIFFTKKIIRRRRKTVGPYEIEKKTDSDAMQFT